MTNHEMLEQAIDLLHQVSINWDEDKVIYYPKELPSFDELVHELMGIELKD